MPDPAPAPPGYLLVEHFGGQGSVKAGPVINSPACTPALDGLNYCNTTDMATGVDLCNGSGDCTAFFMGYLYTDNAFLGVGNISGISRDGDSCYVNYKGVCDDLYMYIKVGKMYQDLRTGKTITATVPSSSAPPLPAIIGGATGGALLILIAAIAAFVCARRLYRQEAQKGEGGPGSAAPFTVRPSSERQLPEVYVRDVSTRDHGDAPRGEPPPTISNPPVNPSETSIYGDPSGWDVLSVMRWAHDAGFSPEIVHILARAEVDGPRLALLTDDGLFALGVESPAARANIIASIRATREVGVEAARRDMEARGGENVPPPSYVESVRPRDAGGHGVAAVFSAPLERVVDTDAFPGGTAEYITMEGSWVDGQEEKKEKGERRS